MAALRFVGESVVNIDVDEEQAQQEGLYRNPAARPSHPRDSTLEAAPPALLDCCRTDPTEGLTKEEAAQAFKEWWRQLPPEDYTIFSDGSEQTIDRKHCVGYGYAIISQTALK
ncbi:hypothetical protein DID88_000348 [Monilinia fructigena]|uniref:Uncharacterized protein n=1 Tax=Monilinia fructigena TaxID=38457 RepID=A0A395IHS1_9HELO|nr:hypothetical protein DID88_000348 [Monilinia fructigena]